MLPRICQQVYVRRQEMERGFVDWKRIGQKNIIEKAGSSNEWTNERTNDRDRDRDRANETKRMTSIITIIIWVGVLFCLFSSFFPFKQAKFSLDRYTFIYLHLYTYTHTHTYGQASAYMAYIYVLISI